MQGVPRRKAGGCCHFRQPAWSGGKNRHKQRVVAVKRLATSACFFCVVQRNTQRYIDLLLHGKYSHRCTVLAYSSFEPIQRISWLKSREDGT